MTNGELQGLQVLSISLGEHLNGGDKPGNVGLLKASNDGEHRVVVVQVQAGLSNVHPALDELRALQEEAHKCVRALSPPAPQGDVDPPLVYQHPVACVQVSMQNLGANPKREPGAFNNN